MKTLKTSVRALSLPAKCLIVFVIQATFVAASLRADDPANPANTANNAVNTNTNAPNAANTSTNAPAAVTNAAQPTATTVAPAPVTNPATPANAAVGAVQPLPKSPGGEGIGVGLILGEPTGLSLKGFVTDNIAVDGAAAWSFDSPSAFQIHSDLLYHNFDLVPLTEGKLPIYFGVGARVKFERHEDTRAGIRVPVGIAYMFAKAPVDIFAELAPGMDVTPRTRFQMAGGVGVRFFFK